LDSGYKGNLTPEKLFGDHNQLLYVIQQVVNKVSTITLVQVKSVTNDGTNAAVGFVDVQPLINQIDGDGKSIPFPVLNNLPYFRLQGGSNAVILDPQVGDIGLAAFAQRDISNVKSTKAQANPGSDRRFDMSDGLYIGGFLNGVPAQYVQFQTTGITVKSPQAVTIDAPATTITGTLQVDGAVTMQSTLDVTSTATAQGTNVHTHVHSGVTTGGSNTGQPV